MNPCAKNKRRLAWMAAGVLDATDAEALRRHFESCPGCRRYWQSMSELSERLVHASDLPPAEPTESFHRRVVQKVTEQPHAPLFNWVITIQRLLREQRLATFSAGVALAIATLLWIQSFSRDEHRVPSGVQIAVVPETAERAASPPTLASYRRAADISFESLDALLTQQAARTSAASETLTVSSLLAQSLKN